MLNTKYQDLTYKVLALERANSLFLQGNCSLEFFLKRSILCVFSSLLRESFDRDCSGGLYVAMLDHSLGNTEFQPLLRVVTCPQSGI